MKLTSSLMICLSGLIVLVGVTERTWPTENLCHLSPPQRFSFRTCGERGLRRDQLSQVDLENGGWNRGDARYHHTSLSHHYQNLIHCVTSKLNQRMFSSLTVQQHYSCTHKNSHACTHANIQLVLAWYDLKGKRYDTIQYHTKYCDTIWYDA